MIDIFTVVVPHALMAIAIWRLIHRDDLDSDRVLPGNEGGLSRLRQGFGGAPGTVRHTENQPEEKAPRA